MTPHDDIPLELITADKAMWLTRQGVPAATVARLMPIMMARGIINRSGYFDPDTNGDHFLVFAEPEDTIFWRPTAGQVATLLGRAFALNEEWIDNAAVCSFDANLNIYATVMDWLRAGCDGIVVLDWSRAFDRLRDTPRIAIDERLLPNYRKWMQPRRMPALSVIPTKERQAA